MIAVCKLEAVYLKQDPSARAATSSQFQVWFAGYIANWAEIARASDARSNVSTREILVRLYQKYGVQFACRIAGTLTWVIHDPTTRVLCAARCRSGEHNLFYTRVGQEIWLSDCIESLLAEPSVSKEINLSSVLLHLDNRTPLPGETYYANICSLQPGGWLRIQDGKLETGRYWKIDCQPALRLKNDEEYALALKDILFEVIPQHMPAGLAAVTLSGGMDSTTVAAVLRNTFSNTPISAITHISPGLPEADESLEIYETAQRLNLSLTSIRADQHWPLSNPKGFSPDQGTPFVPFYADLWQEIFRVAQQAGIYTMFSGSPGDLLFGGSVNGYPDLFLTGKWAELVRQVGRDLSLSSHRPKLTQLISRKVLKPILKAYLPFRRKPAPVAWLHPRYQEILTQSTKKHPFSLQKILPGRKQRLELLNTEFTPTVHEYFSNKASAMGIELRNPLGDHRLMEFAARLPTHQTIRANQHKMILRNAMRLYLPASVVERYPKVLPLSIAHYGLRQKEIAKVWALMSDMRSADLGYIDQPSLRQAYQDYLDGKTNDTRFWNALTLEAWLRRWF